MYIPSQLASHAVSFPVPGCFARYTSTCPLSAGVPGDLDDALRRELRAGGRVHDLEEGVVARLVLEVRDARRRVQVPVDKVRADAVRADDGLRDPVLELGVVGVLETD